MTYKDVLNLGYRTIRANRLRTGITVAIIALGIFALILFLTVLKAASNSLNSTFSSMGANAFSIRFKERRISFSGPSSEERAKATKKSAQREKKSNLGKAITYEQARLFKQNFDYPAKVSIAIRATSNIVVNTDKKKTSPDIRVFGSDENYAEMNGYKIEFGRNFSAAEVESGAAICILGEAVAQKLFPNNKVSAIDKMVKVDGRPFRVVGVMEQKSSSAFFNAGKMVLTTLNAARAYYGSQETNYNIGVMVAQQKMMAGAEDEAIGAFRPIRKLNYDESNNFFIDKSDSVAKAFQNNLRFLEYGIIGVAIITLIASSIGLMNIMLVAVTERTKEIGLIKALGGTSKDIRNQFITESILISLLGAFWGIALGIVFGNIVGLLLNSGLVLLWGWILGGILVCSLVGLFAGLYPAQKAAKLDPIVALRYE